LEPDAVLLPPPPTVTGALAPAVVPFAPAEADGEEFTALTCTPPVELLAEFPPPTCTAPTEFDAVLLPGPPTVVGTEPETDAPAWLAPADGSTPMLPA